jgi:hypothetical protein
VPQSDKLYVTTLDPKPTFTTNVAGVLILKMQCDDHGVLRVGDFAVTNAWPNREYAKAWKVIEANTNQFTYETMPSRNFNMASFTDGQNDLPTNGDDIKNKHRDWQHSTFVQRSYKRTRRLYREIVKIIKGKTR